MTEQTRRTDGPWTVVPEREDFSIPIGPQHPTHKEPMRWTCHVRGEYIVDVDLRLGFNHRGMEKAFEARTWIQNLYLAERLCGICSSIHQFLFCANFEKLHGKYDEVPDRAKYLRMLMLEMERIHSHMLWYGVLAHDAGFDTLWHITWRDREIIMDMCEIMSGNRVNYAFPTLGGARRDVDDRMRDRFLPMLKDLRAKVVYHRDVSEKERSYRARLENVGVLSREDALRFCAVGPTARASGVGVDIRKDDPYEHYDEIPWNKIVYHNGDVYDTMRVRLDETVDSIDMCTYILENLPPGDIRLKLPNRAPQSETITRGEAPRGEDIHYARGNGTDKPERYRIRPPTMANVLSTVHRLKGMQIADIPVVIRSIDPCIGCTERVAFVNVSTGDTTVMTSDELAAKALRRYKYGRPIL